MSNPSFKAVTEEEAEWFRGFFERPFGPHADRFYRQLLAKLRSEDAKDLSDREIARCFAGVVMERKCIAAAIWLREQGFLRCHNIRRKDDPKSKRNCLAKDARGAEANTE